MAAPRLAFGLVLLPALFSAALAAANPLPPGPSLSSAALPEMANETAQRIFGGSNAHIAWARSVARITNSGALCSGVLIDPHWVLTAAHCINIPRATHTDVRIPETATSLGARLAVSQIYILRGYFCDSNKDMAIIRLASPATGRTPIPIKRSSDEGVLENRFVVALGFGLTSYEPRRVPTHAQWVFLRSAIANGAKFRVRDTRCAVRTASNPKPSLICAVAPGYPNGPAKSTCGGDSGGPLLTYFKVGSKYVWKVIGLNSFSTIRCDRPNAVDYFSRVSSFEREITEVMGGQARAWLRVM